MISFHPYPQVIRGFSTPHWFEPPNRFHPTFILLKDRSSRFSRLFPATIRPIQTRFPFGFRAFPVGFCLATEKITSRLIMQRHAVPLVNNSGSIACRLTVSRFYFTPLIGVLFRLFPSRYWFTIYRSDGPIYLSPLSAATSAKFSPVSAGSGPPLIGRFSHTGLSPCFAGLSKPFR